MSGTALLVFARCIGFAFRAPGLSHPSVPPMVRAGLSLMLTMAAMPSVHAVRSPNGLALIAAAVCDFGIGAAIGFGASLLYDGAYAGGRALDDYVGIRGSVPNAPFFAASGFGRIWSLLFTAGFFLLGGYRVAIWAFCRSFERIPPGGAVSVHPLYDYGVLLPTTIIEAALLVAGPAIAVVFVAQTTLGALTRLIPRFAAFTLSFPIVFALALLVSLAAIPFVFNVSGSPWMRLPFLEAH